MKMKKKNGFTMVELLVSLVLITTLSIALFKVVANIQKKEQINIRGDTIKELDFKDYSKSLRWTNPNLRVL